MKIAQVMIFVSDIKASLDFYKNKLGLNVKADLSDNMNMLIMESDDFIFTIHGGHENNSMDDKSRIALCFGVNDLEESISKLKEKGIDFISEITESPVHKYIMFSDLDGSLLEIGQYD